MRRRQRRFHALIWPVLGGLIAFIIVAGVLVKMPSVASRALPSQQDTR